MIRRLLAWCVPDRALRWAWVTDGDEWDVVPDFDRGGCRIARVPRGAPTATERLRDVLWGR